MPPTEDHPTESQAAAGSPARPALALRTAGSVGPIGAWLLALLGWTIIFAGYHLDGGADFEPTDCWVAQTAREMQDADDWIVPRFSGETRLQKSPGAYWAVMLASEIRGVPVDEVAARMPSGVAAVVFVLTIFWLTRRIAGDRAAVFAGFAAASSTLVLYWSHRAASDFALAALVTVSLASLWVASSCEPPGPKRVLLWWLGYFTAGLGMVYKMPMPLACVGLPAWLWLLKQYPRIMLPITIGGVGAAVMFLLDAPPLLYVIPGCVIGTPLMLAAIGKPDIALRGLLWHGIGFALFLLPWLPWVIMVVTTEETAWLKWRVEFLDRFTGDLPNVQHQVTLKHYFIYLQPILVYTIPYTLSLPAAFVRAFRPRSGVNRDGMIFMLIWFFSMLAFFTASVGKETRYFLPALSPLFVMLGCELAALFDPTRSVPRSRVRLAARSVWILVPAGFAAGVVGLRVFQKHHRFLDWSDLWPPYLVFALIFCGGTSLAAMLFLARRRNASFAALVGTMWLTWLWIWPTLMPHMASEKPFIEFAHLLRDRIPVQHRDKLRSVGFQDPRIIWYGDVRFPRIIDQLEMLERQEGDRNLRREKAIIVEEMVDQLSGEKMVLLVAAMEDYLKFLVRVPPELAERGRAFPETHLWLETPIGKAKKRHVVFGNEPPPWPERTLSKEGQRRLHEIAEEFADQNPQPATTTASPATAPVN